MDDADLCYTPAAELAAMIRNRQVSAVEVTKTVLGRIEALEPRINAFATLTPERALDAARSIDTRLANGEHVGPLAGVPFTIKDLSVTAGVPTRRGSHIADGEPGDEDAPFVARLARAGGVMLGKTTTSEFGWKGVSHSPLTGITSNPWREGWNAGASSAGAGAGAAAGYGPLHQGSDGAGSIRMPAHFCGIFGLKPTFGRVPNWPVPNNDLTSHAGPMTRTVLDAAVMLRVMAGPFPLDHWSLDADPADYPALLDQGIRGLRVAWSPHLGHARVDPEVAELTARAARSFEEFGCTVEEVNPSFGPKGPEIIRFTWPVHEVQYARHIEEYGDRMDPGLVACIRAGEGYSSQDYLDMRARKLAYVEEVHRFFEAWDLLLTPAVSVAAFPADRLQPEHWPRHDWDWIQWAEFSYPFNFSGNPAASVPCGFTSNGLPVGLQIVGRRLDDLGVLQAAAAFETAHPWAGLRPAL